MITDEMLASAFRKYQGNGRLAAEELGCSKQNVCYRWNRLNLRPKRLRVIPVSPKSITRNMVLVVFYDSQLQRGHPPGIRELMKAVGMKSTQTISYHISRLVDTGLIAPCGPRKAKAHAITAAGIERAEALIESGQVLHRFVWNGKRPAG